jgi:dihydroorotase
MHEGLKSTMLGLKGMPRIAEEIAIIRNIDLLNYAGGRLHIARLSSARSMELLKAVKKKLNITCDITSYQPLMDDSMLDTFDTNYKVNPPLREKSDNEALIKGLKDGTIDVICSGHVPQDEESKNIEFDHADPGIINLQTFGANLVELSSAVNMAPDLNFSRTQTRMEGAAHCDFRYATP